MFVKYLCVFFNEKEICYMDSMLFLLIVFFFLNIDRKWVSRLVWKFFVDKMRILEGDIGVVLNYIYIGLVFGSFYIWVFLMVRDYEEGIGV